MRPPIFINDNRDPDVSGDLQIFATAESAERQLECHDANDSCMHAHDTEGTKLRIAPRGNGASLEPASERGSESRVLQNLLARFLSVDSDVPLADLVEAARARLDG
jgi:hypothetical protein